MRMKIELQGNLVELHDIIREIVVTIVSYEEDQVDMSSWY